MTVHQAPPVTELRLALRERGYHPVPVSAPSMKVKDAGKRPMMNAWQVRCLDAPPGEIQRWSRAEPDCTNTGLLCGTLIGLDIDVLQPQLSQAIEACAVEMLGPTPLRRIGRAPRALLCYRVTAAPRKIQTADLFYSADPDEKATKVEALAEGEQFVGFGCHPQTERPYEWSTGSPLDVPFADLPETDADRLTAFVREAEAMIRATGAETRAEQRERIRQREEQAREATGTSKHEKPSRATVEDLLQHIPNNCAYDEWVQVGFALYDGLGADGRSVWEAWSAQSPKNEAAFTAKKWDSFSKPGGITVGTLFWLARRNGWRSAEGDKAEASPASISAEPFAWCDPRTIPLREWLLGRHYIKRFVSVTVAPGGVGKSSLAIAEALAMTSGRDLLGEQPASLLKVWYWNGEDPLDELQRRVMATAMHYDLGREDVEGRLFLNSGRQTEIVIAEQTKNGITIAVPVVEAVKRTIVENGIDVVIIDPFVSSHRVSENDNNAIDRVAKAWGKIAEETNCAVELVHHARKTGGNEVQMEDARGAVALISASRTGRILNVMTKEEAERAGVERRRLHFRVDNGKANLAPPPEGSDWFRLASVPLGNGPLGTDGDSIGVVTRWHWPDPLEGLEVKDLYAAQREVAGGIAAGARYRLNVQADDWVGKPIARVLGLDPENKQHRQRIGRLLKIWIENSMFVVVSGETDQRKPTSFVEVGTWACATSE